MNTKDHDTHAVADNFYAEECTPADAAHVDKQCALAPTAVTTTSIEWTNTTWNPVRGCEKVSPGCKHCYAETFAGRWKGISGHPYELGFEPRLVPSKLAEPIRWSPRLVFVNSMSDLFQAFVPDDYIAAVFDVMRAADWHVFQILTKRADRLAAFAQAHADVAGLSHVWLGVSVEDRKYGVPRIETLRAAPAGVRFLSVEPLLEDLGTLDLHNIHWVIVGGESGPGARPMNPEWVTSIRDQCSTANVPFFFKQWGGVNKKKNGRLLDGRLHDDMPTIDWHEAPGRAVRALLRADFEKKHIHLLGMNTTAGTRLPMLHRAPSKLFNLLPSCDHPFTHEMRPKMTKSKAQDVPSNVAQQVSIVMLLSALRCCRIVKEFGGEVAITLMASLVAYFASRNIEIVDGEVKVPSLELPQEFDMDEVAAAVMLRVIDFTLQAEETSEASLADVRGACEDYLWRHGYVFRVVHGVKYVPVVVAFSTEGWNLTFGEPMGLTRVGLWDEARNDVRDLLNAQQPAGWRSSTDS